MATTGRRKNFRRLNLCFSNFMQPFAPESPPSPTTTSPSPTSSSFLHEYLEIDHNRPSLLSTTPTATSSTMIKNFNTLYDHHHRPYPFEPESESDSEPQPADFATAFASNRFFFSSPGRSNSIVETTNTDTDFTPASSSSSTSSSSLMAAAPAPADESDGEKQKAAILNGSVAVPTYSPDPYADFRQSMEEMVEARPELKDVKSNWEALHELLLCYLALNPKSTHKFIIGAFSDLLVNLMSLSSSSPSYSYSQLPQ